MGWYKMAMSILDEEPETWLAYLHGQQLDNIPHLARVKPRFKGPLPQLMVFVLMLLRNVRVRPNSLLGMPVRFLAYAGTVNQLVSIQTTVVSLAERGESVAVILPARVGRAVESDTSYRPLRYSVVDILGALLLLAKRRRVLLKSLSGINPAARNFYYHKFFSAYVHLIYFYRVFARLQPEVVLVSNDHNVENRCMLAVAHRMLIKTAYLQHASVSKLFPALRVNYAFLDGQYALDTYRECEPNQPSSLRNVPSPLVFLTGQKKPLGRSGERDMNSIGIAVNALDAAHDAINLVNALLAAGKKVRLRWHPAQKAVEVAKYKVAFKGVAEVVLSNPRVESVSDFMSHICWLVAGNSSIHLEAALSDVKPIYFELSGSGASDYYGYVKNGLVSWARTPGEIIDFVRERNLDDAHYIEAVRYYSSTYLTNWEGKEGCLVGRCLTDVLFDRTPPSDVHSL